MHNILWQPPHHNDKTDSTRYNNTRVMTHDQYYFLSYSFLLPFQGVTISGIRYYFTGRVLFDYLAGVTFCFVLLLL